MVACGYSYTYPHLSNNELYGLFQTKIPTLIRLPGFQYDLYVFNE